MVSKVEKFKVPDLVNVILRRWSLVKSKVVWSSAWSDECSAEEQY
jgi:hypothetical protein